MDVVVIGAGAALVVFALADLVNTLVSTSTSSWRFWPSRFLARSLFNLVRRAVARLPDESALRERVLVVFGPSLLLFLLMGWVALQITGFGLIWSGVDGVAGVDSIGDGIYYSGVVFFTVGFGEVLPTAAGARAGALIEAGLGVVTTALVIGYLPSLYAAYSSREQFLISIDDGSGERITPTDLVIAWAPDADVEQLHQRMAEAEAWVAGMIETHSTLPLLMFFRSHDRRQNWVTAVGLLCDVAVHCQIMVDGVGKTPSYWYLRRAITLFDELIGDKDLDEYDEAHRVHLDRVHEASSFFTDLYARLEAHGFAMVPFEEAAQRAALIRNRWAPQMEALIDVLLCPRGFWSPDLGPLLLEEHDAVLEGSEVAVADRGDGGDDPELGGTASR